MRKKIYVEGNILINTPYFKSPEAGAYFPNPPEGSEIIEAKCLKDGTLEINEENPQSNFNEYFAKYEFASYYEGAEFLYKTFQDVYKDYHERINDIKEVINLDVELDKHREILNRLYYINIVASLDTFVADIIVTKVIENEETFYKYYNIRSLSKTKKESLSQMLDNDKIGNWEQEIIECIIRESYANIETIKKTFKDLFHVSITDKNNKMKSHFRKRHVLAHKNGREKNGDYLVFTQNDLSTLISDSNEFVEHVMCKINSASADVDIHPCNSSDGEGK